MIRCSPFLQSFFCCVRIDRAFKPASSDHHVRDLASYYSSLESLSGHHKAATHGSATKERLLAQGWYPLSWEMLGLWSRTLSKVRVGVKLQSASRFLT